MERHPNRLSFIATVSMWLATCLFAFGIAGSWNGVAITAWNGVAQTSWNGTGVSQAAGGGGGFNTSGLVAWWDADGDLADNSGNSHTATAQNSMGYATGPFSDANGAWNTIFSGNSKYASVADHAAFTPAGDLSIVLWVNCSAAIGTMGITGHGTVTGTDIAFKLRIQGGANDRLMFAISDDGVNIEEQISTNGTYPDAGAWTHIAVVYVLSTHTVTYYRNGASVGTDTFTTETGALFNSSSVLTVGQCDGANGTTPMARVSLWTRALTATEVDKLWDGANNDNAASDVKFADLASIP